MGTSWVEKDGMYNTTRSYYCAYSRVALFQSPLLPCQSATNSIRLRSGCNYCFCHFLRDVFFADVTATSAKFPIEV